MRPGPKCAMLLLCLCVSIGCGRYVVNRDAQVPGDEVVRAPDLSDELSQRVAAADQAMQQGTPLAAEGGVTIYNELLQTAEKFYVANAELSGWASSALSQALDIATELRGELLARYPEVVHDAEPARELAALYQGPGRWYGPRNYLTHSSASESR